MNKAAEKPPPQIDEPDSARFVIGVRLRGQWDSELFDPQDLNLRVGSWIMVDTKQGEKLGVVASNKIINWGGRCRKVQGKALRFATDQDFADVEKKETFEKKGKEFCLQQIESLGLSMNLSRVVYLKELNKTLFYFTADGRVDFRELVRKLAHNLKTRIEMRQVGVRDEAKAITGFGVCGQQLCCSTFLDEFSPVTIRMAKDQGLALNPGKISGVCGRLMCCLQYEHQIYRELVKNIPKYGTMVVTPDGRGKVIKSKILEKTVSVLLEDESIMSYHIDLLEGHSPPQTEEKQETAPPEPSAQNVRQNHRGNHRENAST
ncbi:MAG: stage 0 sporulation family protein [Nitrospinales bacterium]